MTLESRLSSFLSDSGLSPRSAVLVACSGGPDSVALATALSRLDATASRRVVVGHVNHKLRGAASDGDERFVRALARRLRWGVQNKVSRVPKSAGNLEEQARVSRYAALHSMAVKRNCKAILTGHTHDDQAETVFMNLFRGCGVDALSGMDPVWTWPNAKIPILRPWLDTTKSEIRAYLKRLRIPFRTDRSNADTAFRRNWIRKKLMPGLKKVFPGAGASMVRLAEIVRDENVVWNSILTEMERSVLKTWKKRAVLDIKGLLSYPPALQRRLLRRRPGGDLLTFDGVERLRQWLKHPPTQGRIWQMRKGWAAERLSKTQGAPSAHWLWIRRTSQT